MPTHDVLAPLQSSLASMTIAGSQPACKITILSAWRCTCSHLGLHERTKADKAFLLVEIELRCRSKRFAPLMFPRSQCNRSVGMRRQTSWSSLLSAIFTSEDASETVPWSGHISRHCHLLGIVLMPLAGLALCTHTGRRSVCSRRDDQYGLCLAHMILLRSAYSSH